VANEDTSGPIVDRINQVDIQVEMQRSYLDYAMSVIVGRALPDVRDGLKPVHRRVIYSMYDGGYRPDKAFSKCSRVVGDVMGKSTLTATPQFMTPLCVSSSHGACAIRWPPARETLEAPAMMVPPLPRYTETKMGQPCHGDGSGHRRRHGRLPRQLRRKNPRTEHSSEPFPQFCW